MSERKETKVTIKLPENWDEMVEFWGEEKAHQHLLTHLWQVKRKAFAHLQEQLKEDKATRCKCCGKRTDI